MIPLEEAQATVFAAAPRLDSETVALGSAVGRVLFEDVLAPENVPPFRNSAMDGYAVRAVDVAGSGATLDVVGELAAGLESEVSVGPGQALKIMTGARMPPGADTVVRVEDTTTDGKTVTVTTAVEEGVSVRAAGGDVREGQLVFAGGTRLTPMHIGVLATLGVARPTVTRRPKVAFMSTGDELRSIDTVTLGPGAIRDSNRPMLAALLDDAGAETIDMGPVSDDEAELRAVLERAANDADVIVSTGGVSMGDRDVTKLVLSGEEGVSFWKVAMQPAKPFAFGKVGRAAFFGLPGNPVSALISFETFVRPTLLAMQRARFTLRSRAVAVAAEEFATDPAKTVFLRVVITGFADGLPTVAAAGGQGSNVLSAAADADALAVIERGVGVIQAGGRVEIEMFKSPESRQYVPDE